MSKLMSQKKNVKSRATCLVIAIIMFVGVFASSCKLNESTSVQAQSSGKEFRGVWVATVHSLNYPSKKTTDPEVLKADAIKILDNAQALGLNAVFLQVRPSSDALYKSKVFPWSKYLTGTQGLAPANDFDPLTFFVEEAHKRNIELHAWLNPYRITAEENETLAPDHPAVKHPAWAIKYSDGRLYWNPGEPGAQKIIADGVQEIVDNYNVDGIHIDDYFYPGKDFNDSACFSVHGGGHSSVTDWRLSNTETTVKNMYDIVHNSGKKMVFGVSPIGIWANKSSSSLGSNTNGGEAYIQKYADTRGWVKRQIVDYISPQIYWNIGFDKAEYKTLVDWWSDVVEGTNVDLYIGQAAYRVGNTSSSSPWYGVSEIKRQIDYNRTKTQVGGYIMYSYSSILNSPDLYALIKELNNAAVSPPITPDPSAPFSDIQGHWAESFFLSMSEKGIIKGDTNGKANPDNNVKRGDFVLMLMRMLNIKTETGLENFKDVPTSEYYANELATAKKLGLISGIGDNIFSPESSISREDMFTIVYRALISLKIIEDQGNLQALNGFSDSAAISSYGTKPIAAFVEKGIITGSNNKLNPGNKGTRAETAAILHRILETFDF